MGPWESHFIFCALVSDLYYGNYNIFPFNIYVVRPNSLIFRKHSGNGASGFIDILLTKSKVGMYGWKWSEMKNKTAEKRGLWWLWHKTSIVLVEGYIRNVWILETLQKEK